MKNAFNCGKRLWAPGRAAPLAALAAVGIALAGASISANRPPTAAPAIVGINGRIGADAVRGKYPPAMVPPGQGKFDGAYREAIAFSTTDRQYSVRVWESGPGILKTDDYPYDEYCLILTGRLQITNASGSTEAFGPGDSFVIPKGWRGTWDMKTRMKKIYIDLIPAADAPRE